MPAATASSIPSLASLKGPVDEIYHPFGHLYTRIAAFVSTQDRPSVGMIEQSLCHHLQMLLTEYYRLIAVLESQMGNTFNSAPGSQSDTVAGEETGLTLKRLDVWITEWRLRMRMMSVCVKGACDVYQVQLSRFGLGSNEGEDEQYGRNDIAGLEHSIDGAYSTASARLFEVFTEKFHLLDSAALTAQLTEITIHQSLSPHPNIVTLHRTESKTPPTPSLLATLATMSNLFSFKISVFVIYFFHGQCPSY
ncbi:hypothetical protein DFJ58DRAFT_855357 [Suillus subalutaceus]|uniref:uncharacterized protein n=1 Tax=Suillus subalutaceus TaxID=48586 RepID=UPI001B860419|nr:uncharacterized protein DFJ58DRAFT_855357 [Suillus subalutaceus]KAG1842408.1 hypothetical protein DFJ58DRAFT_855357 [Suillus subalutaceus]